MSTQTGPMAISPRLSMSSVPALPGVKETFSLKAFSFLKASDMLVHFALLVGAVEQRLGVVAEGVDPADDEGDAGHAALDAVVAELLGVLLDPVRQRRIALRRIGDEGGIVGERRLAVEHRHDVALDVRAQRVVGVGPRDEIARLDVGAVLGQQVVLDEVAGRLLVDDRDVGVPAVVAGLLLRLEALDDLLRAGVARARADGADGRSRILLLEHRARDSC